MEYVNKLYTRPGNPGSWFAQLAVSRAFHPTILFFRTKTYPTLPLSLVWPDRERLYFSWRLRIFSPSALVGCSLSCVPRTRPSCISRFVVVPHFIEDATSFCLRANLFFLNHHFLQSIKSYIRLEIKFKIEFDQLRLRQIEIKTQFNQSTERKSISKFSKFDIFFYWLIKLSLNLNF